MMKKIVALLLALTFLCLAFASCGNDGLDGKSFSYEKIEVKFENEELQEAMNKLLKDGQSIADYFAENYLDGMGEMTYTFKDGKMYGEVDGESLGEGIDYTLDGKNIVIAGEDMPEGTTYGDFLNTNSVRTLPHAKLEASMADAPADARFQFVRNGYFIKDSKHEGVYNNIVNLKDSWAKAKK